MKSVAALVIAAIAPLLAASPVMAAKDKPAESIQMDYGYQEVTSTRLTRVQMSKGFINRLSCGDEYVGDVVVQQSKGITTEKSTEQKDVLVAFSAPVRDSYEMYVVCGETMYILLILPTSDKPQVVKLGGGVGDAVKANVTAFKGMPWEKRALELIQHVYDDKLPNSYTVKPRHVVFDVFKDITITLTREVRVYGIGLMAKEYHVVSAAAEPVELEETDFLIPELADSPVALALDTLILKPGQTVRLFVVESTERMGGR